MSSMYSSFTISASNMSLNVTSSCATLTLLALSMGQRLCINFFVSREKILTTCVHTWTLLVLVNFGLVYLVWMFTIIIFNL